MTRQEPPTTTEEPAPAQAGAVGDLGLGLGLVAVCVWAAGQAWAMPRRGDLGLLTSPGLTPFLACAVIATLSLILVGHAVWRGALSGIRARLVEMAGSDESRRVVVLAVLMGVYVALIGVVHYAVVTTGFLLASFLFVRAGGWVTIVVATVLGVGLTAFAIPYAFTMPLP